MPLLSRIELEAKQEGFQQGFQEGFQQGILQGAREVLLVVLEVRFEVVPPEVIEAVNQIEDTSVLKRLLKQAIAIPSIEDFQQLLEQPSVSEENLPGKNEFQTGR